MPEHLFDKSSMDVRNIIIESGSTSEESTLDFENDILPETWQVIRRAIEFMAEALRMQPAAPTVLAFIPADMLKIIKLCTPGRFAEFYDPLVYDRARQYWCYGIANFREDVNLYTPMLGRLYIDLKNLEPSFPISVTPTEKDALFDYYSKKYEKHATLKPTHVGSFDLLTVMMLMSERASDLRLDDVFFTDFQRYLAARQQNGESAEIEIAQLRLAIADKPPLLLNAELAHRLRSELRSPGRQQQMTQKTNNTPQDRLDVAKQYLNLAYALRVGTAKNLTVRDGVVTIDDSSRKDTEETHSPLPEMRRY